MKKLVMFLLLLGSAISAYAQNYSISGIVTVQKTNERASDVLIVLMPGEYSATSNSSGEYIITNVPEGKYVLKASLIGFNTYTADVTLNRDLRENNFSIESLGFITETIEVNRAVDRETPVAFTTINEKTLGQRRQGQDAPLLLRNVPGFYAYSPDGVGNGEGKLLIRGFNQNYVQVLVNGIPTNDPESNAVYWSNWGSVSANASSIQIQRGAGSSLYGSGAFGGSFNILTNSDLNRFLGANLTVGDPKNSIYGVNLSSGLLKGKFAGSLNVERKISDGSRTSGRYEGLNYYTSISFYPSSSQSINVILHGAPQKHGYSWSNNIIYFKKYGYTANSAPLLPMSVVNMLPNNATTGASNYGINTDSRVLRDDDYVNLSHNFYHKPQLELHFNQLLKDNSTINATLFYSLGRGGGSSLTGTGTLFSISRNTNAFAGTGFTLDTLKTNLYNGIGIIGDTATARTYLLNAQQRISYSFHRQFGILASYSKDFSKLFSITSGAEFRSWRADHPGQFTNLFGKTSSTVTYAAIDTSNKIGTFSRKVYQGDLNGPQSDVGNIFGWDLANDPTYRTQYRNYVGETPQFTLFTQGNVKFDNIGLNLMGSIQYVWYKYKLTENMPSENAIGQQLTANQIATLGITQEGQGPNGKFYMQGTNNKWYSFDLVNQDRSRGFLQPKVGFNWNATKNLNLFGNFAHVERFVDLGVYYNQGRVNPDAEDEKSNQFELGFGWTSGIFSAKLNGYYMLWDNRSSSLQDQSKAGTPGYDRNGFRTELIGTSKHMGTELEAGLSLNKWLPIKGLGLKGSMTYMNNKWQTVLDNVKFNPDGTRRVFNANSLDANGNVVPLYFDQLEGTPVASGPQFMTSVSLTYDNYGFFASFDMSSFAKDYALDGGTYIATNSEFYGIAASGKELYKTQYEDKLPSRVIFDFNAGYNLNIKGYMKGSISFQVLNLFDTEFLASSDRSGVIPGIERTYRLSLALGY